MIGTVNQKRLLRRLAVHHLPIAVVSIACVVLLYITRPYHDLISKLSFATAYPALVLLVITLWIGPWNVLRKKRMPVSGDLRRDIGIWAGILGIVHTVVGLNVHMRGRPWLYFIYPKTDGGHWTLRHDLFGFANDTGVVASVVLLLLFATSNDYAIRALGTPRWKQLQRWNYVLFAFAMLHTAAYLTIEKQQMSYVAVVVVCAVISLFLQAWGFQARRNRTTKI